MRGDLDRDQMISQDGELGDFPQWVQLHQAGLRQYCQSLVGTTGEADDLAQETWLKVWKVALGKGAELNINKSYLYRIANHVWIDRYRKKKINADLLSVHDTPSFERSDTMMIWTAMETMVNHLPVNQRITLLLMDVFQYTAAETAQLLDSTEGAVKAVLHRARMKLRTNTHNGSRDFDPTVTKKAQKVENKVDEKVVYAYLEAFREQNATALIMLMNDNSQLDMVPVALNRRKADRVQVQRTSNFEEHKNLVSSSNPTLYAMAA
ncbi:RNA polymerase sigma factor [Paenibacillus sp. FSL K6-2524]|uniref:RNA polymerase sigma factor n=1 Tax=Paenibacillus sp. FSL K6-2524 TaxID=2954516 RepID=UPI0030FA18D4